MTALIIINIFAVFGALCIIAGIFGIIAAIVWLVSLYYEWE